MDINQYIKDGKCPICFHEATIRYSSECDGFWINCENCGQFILDQDVVDYITDTHYKLRSCMHYYLSQQKVIYETKKIVPKLYTGEIIEGNTLIPINHMYIKYIHLNSVLQCYPSTINDKISMIMLNLGSSLKYIGNSFQRFHQNNYPLFFIDEENGFSSAPKQLKGMIDILINKGLICESTSTIESYEITLDGWLMIEAYQKSNKNLAQAFIAMWFDPSMEYARKAISDAISESGYFPMIIDLKEHNNQIVPEILYEIKRSEFVVADFTGGRGGVYYESGYAHGLDKEVISCCRESDFDNLHFDLKQKSAIVWSDENDLKKRLKKRIEVTVGKRNKI